MCICYLNQTEHATLSKTKSFQLKVRLDEKVKTIRFFANFADVTDPGKSSVRLSGFTR